jgi:hypothetical protein
MDDPVATRERSGTSTDAGSSSLLPAHSRLPASRARTSPRTGRFAELGFERNGVFLP